MCACVCVCIYLRYIHIHRLNAFQKPDARHGVLAYVCRQKRVLWVRVRVNLPAPQSIVPHVMRKA